jgi:hypothetical protein
MSEVKLSKETLDIIITELDISSERSKWELNCVPLNSDAYFYWLQRQSTIKKALEELRRAIC